MQTESIIIALDWRTGRIVYCKPDPLAWFHYPNLNETVEWDGRGFATIHHSVMADRLIERAPEVGDVIEIDGRSLVIIERDPMTRSYRALTESLEAHQLALWYITYWSDLDAQLWPIRAYERINEHFISDVQERLMGVWA